MGRREWKEKHQKLVGPMMASAEGGAGALNHETSSSERM